jgi:hypothetical protein
MAGECARPQGCCPEGLTSLMRRLARTGRHAQPGGCQGRFVRTANALGSAQSRHQQMSAPRRWSSFDSGDVHSLYGWPQQCFHHCGQHQEVRRTRVPRGTSRGSWSADGRDQQRRDIGLPAGALARGPTDLPNRHRLRVGRPATAPPVRLSRKLGVNSHRENGRWVPAATFACLRSGSALCGGRGRAYGRKAGSLGPQRVTMRVSSTPRRGDRDVGCAYSRFPSSGGAGCSGSATRSGASKEG